ncbi:abnormal spindle-like microcephaly-associated protein [Pleurodeles waltl]|uniref:abnormal spindle-like microcephaly-associated protein n=1 Tax=Pleurodeles waltl TaxID=8319 RepID=UPI0037095E10
MESRASRPVHLDIGQPSPEGQIGQDEQYPVLVLGLFSRPPFVCFDCVRLGTSRTALLAIDNPNTEPVDVLVERVPEERGFSLEERKFLMRPMEKKLVSIRWTPLEEGGVRELLNFVTNGIVKHRVILLGKAEQPVKKKKSLWEAIKKKNSSALTNSSRPKKKDSNIKTINKTKSVSEKNNYRGIERVRSPLQSCENLEVADSIKSLKMISQKNVENQMPSPPIRLQRKEHFEVTGASDILRSSISYSTLCADTYCESLQGVTASSSVHKEFHFVEEAASKVELEQRLSLSPINPISRDSRVTCTPGSLRRSTTYSVLGSSVYRESFQTTTTATIVQDDFNFNVEKTLTPQAFLNGCVSATVVKEAPDKGSSNCTNRPAHTPDEKTFFPTPLSQRKFLSPDSFVNDSYQPDEEAGPSEFAPILSPDQFVRENISSIKSSLNLQEYESLLLSFQSSSVNVSQSSFSSSPPSEHQCVAEEQKVLSCVSVCEESDFSNITLDEFEPLPSRLTFFIKPKQECNSLESVQHKKGQVNSETVIKSKSAGGDEKSKKANTPPKARRCLKNSMANHESIALENRKSVRFLDLPVIDTVLCSTNVLEADLSSPDLLRPSLVSRKRKSGELIENVIAKVATNEHPELIRAEKIIAPFTKVKQASMQKVNVTKHKSEEQKNQRKKAVSLALKSSSLKTHNVEARKSAFMKHVHIEPPSQKSTQNLKRAKRVVAVPQSQLTFVKPAKTAIPRHPMPFAAKNMFYDERWKEKQERGFTWWLNFILTPDDLKADSLRANAAAVILGAENHHKASVPKAPSKEEVSLKAYTARCRLNRLRRAACRLFTSETVVKAIKRLEIEIEAKRLLVRKDRHLWKDVGERQKVLHWLLSYNPLWLRIGLETIFGELISLESNSDVMGLALFVLNRLLWNPDIAAEYRHPTVPHLYRDGHEDALSKFTLKKLLLLVFFLDHAKQSRLIDHDPCLFCKDSDFKTSKDVLLAISRDFLSGEGDLSRHLSYLGLPVSHVQMPLDEFDFAVTNLAVDLQCGVRLVRAMELLTQNWTLSKKLRVPAISRLQKMHNVEVVLHVLKERNVQLTDEHGTAIDSRDIVDRHRERTLALLWRIVSAFQVDVLLNVEEVKEEITFLKQSWILQKKIGALRLFSNLPNLKRASSGNFSSLKYSENVGLLMEWVNATCAFYNTKVENFTVSFSDGRVLCYLIHHYHPSYMPLREICQQTTQTVECTEAGSIGLNSSTESENSLDTWPIAFDQTITNSPKYKELLENEKKNFHLLNAAVADLGGVPAMINHSDMSNTIPDEKVVITYLSFLCARLLDLRKETRAARVIQSAWRRYKLKAELQLLEKKNQAARKIQALVTGFLIRRRLKNMISAVVVLQKNWKRFLAQKQARQLKLEKLKIIQWHAAKVIQAHWRLYSARRYYLQLRYSAIRMQARIRMKIAVLSYERIMRATLTIQRYVRAWQSAKRERRSYRALQSSTIVIQAAFRRWSRRNLLKRTRAALVLQAAVRKWRVKKAALEEKAAVLIQSWYRMYLRRKWYLRLRQSSTRIQACFRCLREKRAYETKRRHIITLQRYCRAYLQGKYERQEYVSKRTAVIRLQAAFRAMKARQLQKQVRAAILFQSLWRMRRERQRFLYVKTCVISIQAHVRKWQQQSRYTKYRNAARLIQARYRGHLATKRAVSVYSRIYSAVMVLQAAYRNMRSRREARVFKSAVTIQAFYRAYVTRKKFQKLKRAITRIQGNVRMRHAQEHYRALKKAVLFVQRHYRSKQCIVQHKAEFRRKREACICLQAALRGHLIRKQMHQRKKAATVLQTQYRMFRQRQCYLTLRSAAVVIQHHFAAYRAQVYQRRTFLKLKASAVCIQAAYRGYRTRKALKMQVSAALAIQTVFRAYSARKHYLLTLKACLTIQKFARAYIICKRQRQNFLKVRKAAVCLQSAYRGLVVRRQIQKQHTAAVVLQSSYRKVVAQKQFRRVKQAVLTVQQHYRAYSTAQKQRTLYLKQKSATITLQAAWRGRATRQQARKLRAAATTIQAAFRAFSLRRRYVAYRGAAVTVQRWYRASIRAKVLHWHYLYLRWAVITLQAGVRGMRVRRQMKHLHQAATTIQKAFRGHQRYVAYSRMKMAATVIQIRYKASCLCRKDRSEYVELKRATVTLQAACRGALARQEQARMRRAATQIQAYFRMHLQRRYYKNLVMATKSMQLIYRACRVRNRQVCEYQALKDAVACIQSAYRGLQTRRYMHRRDVAATIIQRRFKSYLERERFLSLKKATVVVQRLFRYRRFGSHQRKHYICLREAAITVQAGYRGWKVRKDIQGRHRAARVIQATFRMHIMSLRFRAAKLAAITIQRHYRAYRLAIHERKNFLKERRSVVVLQAAYRGMKTRQHLKMLNKAATIIQASYRMSSCKTRYRKIHCATKVIQERFRANGQRDVAVKNYCAVKEAACCLQAAFRGMRLRKHLRAMHRAAKTIQTRFKALLEHRRFLKLRHASVAIQRRYRALIVGRQQRQEYLSLRKAVILVQAAHRGSKVRGELRTMHQAATSIQSAFRMHRARVGYKTMQMAASVIQSYYRSHIDGQKQRARYTDLRKSVVVLQAAYRGMKVRQNVQDMHAAATVLQSYYLMHRQRVRYKKTHWAVATLQERYRAKTARDSARQQYLRLKNATVCIQAAFRGKMARQQLQEMHSAAVVIQKHLKSRSQQRRYLALRAAVIVCQQRYRASFAAKQQHQDFIRVRKAAVSIQSAYRGSKVRREVQQLHAAAATVQSAFRMHRARAQYKHKKRACCVIQTFYRSYMKGKQEREEYLALRKAAVVIQAAYRRLTLLRHMKRLHTAATVIQSEYRMHRQRKRYSRMCWAVQVFEQRYQAKVARDSEVHHYRLTKKAVLCIQTAFRAMKARQLAKKMVAARRIQSVLLMYASRKRFLEKKTASVVIQSAFRGYVARARYKAIVVSAVLIQKWYRACRLSHLQRHQYLLLKKSAVTVQSAFRGLVARRLAKEKRAVRKIQAYLHMMVYRRKYIQLRSCVCTIQACYRMYAAQKQYRMCREAALVLQTRYRGHLAMKRQREAFLRKLADVITVQAAVRRFVEQKRFQQIKTSAIQIQALWRGYTQRRTFLNCKASAMTIQMHFRAHRARTVQRQKYTQMKDAAILIQAMYRRFQARQIICKTRAAQTIQTCYRGYKARKEYRVMLFSIQVIQNYLQTKLQRTRFLRMRAAVVLIQRRWRETLTARRICREFETIKAAIIKIQSVHRGVCVRRQLLKKKEAASLIQGAYRGFRERRKFLRLKAATLTFQSYLRAVQEGRRDRLKYITTRNAVIWLQSLTRGWLVRRMIVQQKQEQRILRFSAAAYLHLSALKIQRKFKVYLALRRAKRHMDTVVFIQSCFRARLQQKKYLDDRSKIIRLQRATRSWLSRRNKAACVIQRLIRHFLLKKRKEKILNGVIQIQALWRGYFWRSRHDTPKLLRLRNRLVEVTMEQKEENKLCNRTSIAIDYLLKFKHLSYILAALKHLEVATRLSSVCCENMARSGAIVNIFILIRSCNRSIPCMEVIKYSIQVLLNLSKYEKTTQAVYAVDNSVDTLTELMQTYREKAGDKVADKGGSIFTKTCCLLAILSLDTKRALEIRAVPKAVDRICSIYKLTARKHKMDAQRTLSKRMMSSVSAPFSRNATFAMQATPVRTKLVSRIKPDWILRKDNMKEIEDPLKAIEMLMDTLSIAR